MRGIPAVVITVEPEETEQARPSRALCHVGFGQGHSLGRANDAAFQTRIVEDALELLVKPVEPGTVVRKTYR